MEGYKKGGTRAVGGGEKLVREKDMGGASPSRAAKHIRESMIWMTFRVGMAFAYDRGFTVLCGNKHNLAMLIMFVMPDSRLASDEDPASHSELTEMDVSRDCHPSRRETRTSVSGLLRLSSPWRHVLLHRDHTNLALYFTELQNCILYCSTQAR